jgi:hypothetical protein
LDDIKVSYETEGISRSYEDQVAMLTAEKRANPNIKVVFSQVLQDTFLEGWISRTKLSIVGLRLEKIQDTPDSRE